MTIEDKSGFSDWDTYEPKPQPTPPDIQAKQFTTDFVWKCPNSGAVINGASGDYLVNMGGSCIKMNSEQFEASYRLKE